GVSSSLGEPDADADAAMAGGSRRASGAGDGTGSDDCRLGVRRAPQNLQKSAPGSATPRHRLQTMATAGPLPDDGAATGTAGRGNDGTSCGVGPADAGMGEGAAGEGAATGTGIGIWCAGIGACG